MPFVVSDRCPECGSTLSVRKNKNSGNRFIGCNGYRAGCRYSASFEQLIEDLQSEKEQLESRLYDVLGEVRSMKKGAPLNQEAVQKELRAMAARFHPDRGSTLDATEVCAALNALRTRIMSKP